MLPVPLLYLIVVLVWGSTWYAIKLQLGPVAEELSVAYRFALASVCLFALTAVSGRSLRVPRENYPGVVLQGLLMFSISYLLVYFGSGFITTGLVAVLYSLIIVFNGVFEWLFFRTLFDRRLVLASIIGLSGIALVFWPEVASVSLNDRVLQGVAWTLGSVAFASLGNMVAIRNTTRAVPVTLINAHGMIWGAALSFMIALSLDRPIHFALTADYVVSLMFLAVFGSCVAFGCYLALLKRIGAARASYVSLLFPVVALLISTIYVDYRWSGAAMSGVMLILTGNWLALSRLPKRNRH